MWPARSTSYSRVKPSAGASQETVTLCDPISFTSRFCGLVVLWTTGRVADVLMVSEMPYVGLPSSSRFITMACTHTHCASLGSHG